MRDEQDDKKEGDLIMKSLSDSPRKESPGASNPRVVKKKKKGSTMKDFPSPRPPIFPSKDVHIPKDECSLQSIQAMHIWEGMSYYPILLN